ncbi:aminoacyl-tRNA hydrolase [bacterium]|nr:aminoacyl-tRNA hydrolase [bacterium]
MIVGLGNPGSRYQRTKHNLGFMVLDFLADQAKASFKKGPGAYDWLRMGIGDAEAVCIKPMTFMNRSGRAVADAKQRLSIPDYRTLIILDDLALPLGKLRLRAAGSPGGHNGLSSVCRYVHSEAIPRLRLGIGISSKINTVEYVLTPFPQDSLKIIERMIAGAGQAVQDFVNVGIQQTMNIVNSLT